jgi:hypothetical protein
MFTRVRLRSAIVDFTVKPLRRHGVVSITCQCWQRISALPAPA